MKKEDVIWHKEDESIVMEDADGWKIICVMNHFKGTFHYEIQAPDGFCVACMSDNIYEAIDKLNQKKKLYII